ncbi:MAG: hypothetical protein Unbinned3992contig1000_61 [Prokaryotic dsDNA virus sp.]|nr:MAG: hypothetical protein Unbinned3992contig1000_61 [Prokaryotic dsDNA virus sp.]|tara:strand:- start:22256 stop:22735 length:480 start_codon:yes stop_codon:yes gene_type:complete
MSKKTIKPGKFAMQIQTDAARWRDAAIAALYDEATDIINKSIPITPLDNGDLRRSAFVTRPQDEGPKVSVELGYGGFASKYALAVHEMGTGKSRKRNATGQFISGGGINWSEPGTGNKYLEKPFDAAKRGQARRIELNAYKRFLSGFTAILPQHNQRPR